jgi:hypothetical protein
VLNDGEWRVTDAPLSFKIRLIEIDKFFCA